MGLRAWFKKRREAKRRQQLIRYSLILFGLNVALMLAGFLVMLSVLLLVTAFEISSTSQGSLMMLILFAAGAAGSLVWYRYGQLLQTRFTDRPVIAAGTIVFFSLVLQLVLIALIALVLQFVQGVALIAFISTVVITLMGVGFEIALVCLGAGSHQLHK